MSRQSNGPFAYYGTLIHSISPSKLEILQDAVVVVDGNGRISLISPHFSVEGGQGLQEMIPKLLKQPDARVRVTTLKPHQFIVPGFIDTHVHAPQFSMRGLGQGLHILDWLDQVTFPHESRFNNNDYATEVFTRCVQMGLRQGITTACYFASLHTEATKILADVCLQEGQRAFVGKTCMDHPETNPKYYREETAEAEAGTEELIQHCRAVDESGTFVRPVLTPRFAISCTPELLTRLGKLGREHEHAYGLGEGVPNQTHFCEAQQEIDATLKQYGKFSCEADLYEHYGLLNSMSVLAHCTLLSHDDLVKIKQRECGIAHCPISNVTVGGGFMAAPVRRFFSEGITKVGLGTDSGGGFSCSLMDVMRQALIVANAREMLSEGKERRLGLEEVFYMATLGGPRILGMQDRVGSFEVGKRFDAILVDMQDPYSGPHDDFDAVHTTTLDEFGDNSMKAITNVWQKWIMSGDDRNLRRVWVGGQMKKDTYRAGYW
ncbi:hypothetical protein A1O7_04723 [Cladophialophora yegresii CBS 114405]|uniref:Probable guanine deaminase n=1 Tax=Cladophialophora yegresii CBS 114405 TaxID=1182544 RepID=W9W6E7_9EURO|nr:uncharacterized protein A1O7_04723 [Cladophialophora yegresii CBS 114405]EXJ60570.1 hypothetical protein A1O7_04723 [Cladophialophora yegresii CBS 114405]